MLLQFSKKTKGIYDRHVQIPESSIKPLFCPRKPISSAAKNAATAPFFFRAPRSSLLRQVLGGEVPLSHHALGHASRVGARRFPLAKSLYPLATTTRLRNLLPCEK